MELSKKTTILFPPELHERLSRLAAEMGSSLGELVRSACENQYGPSSREEKVAAVARLGALRLPIGTTLKMKRQAVPKPKDILR